MNESHRRMKLLRKVRKDWKYKIILGKTGKYELTMTLNLDEGMATKLFDQALKKAKQRFDIPDNMGIETWEIPSDYYKRFYNRFYKVWKPQIEANQRMNFTNFKFITNEIQRILYTIKNKGYEINIYSIGDFSY